MSPGGCNYSPLNGKLTIVVCSVFTYSLKWWYLGRVEVSLRQMVGIFGISKKVYVGYPRQVGSDHEAVFMSNLSRDLSEVDGIDLQLYRNAIGVEKMYHAPLQGILLVLSRSQAPLGNWISLLLAMKAMNDAMEPKELFPSLFLFGVMPSLPVINEPFPEQKDRMAALSRAWAGMETVVAEIHILQDISFKFPSVAHVTFKPSDELRIYKEEDCIWFGPVIVIREIEKEINVAEGNIAKNFGISQVI